MFLTVELMDLDISFRFPYIFLSKTMGPLWHGHRGDKLTIPCRGTCVRLTMLHAYYQSFGSRCLFKKISVYDFHYKPLTFLAGPLQVL